MDLIVIGSLVGEVIIRLCLKMRDYTRLGIVARARRDADYTQHCGSGEQRRNDELLLLPGTRHPPPDLRWMQVLEFPCQLAEYYLGSH